MKLDLRSATLAEVCQWVAEHGQAAFRGKQIFQWVQQKGVVDFQAMINLPQDLRQHLATNAFLTTPRILREIQNNTGDTAKLLLEWSDTNTTELVIMLYTNDHSRDRQTCCISTQVGCGMKCAFCATALGGFKRNLTAGEIVAQVQVADAWCRNHGYQGVSNVVYMGMGEPLANFEAVLRSIALLNHPQGLHIGQRKITISTCGIIPQIDALALEGLEIGLAVSLHAPTDELRSFLMPINKTYPIAPLLAACKRYSAATGRRVTYEYALFHGINDSLDAAHCLGRLLKGTLSHVNFIPANQVPETNFSPAEAQQIQKFAHIVEHYGVATSVRESRGGDIAAACGQLRQLHQQETAAQKALR